MATNPNFRLSVPAGWTLSTSAVDSQSESGKFPASKFASSAASDVSRSTSLSWDMVRPPSIAADSIVSPITDPTTESVNGDQDLETTPQLSSAMPQLRALPNGLHMKLPARDVVVPTKQSETTSGTPVAVPASSTPRRPPLPPTTPNDELPPPSPRPSHARPSPLPRAGFASHAVDVQSASNATSPLKRVASTSVDMGLEATYRAPEDLAVATTSSSYFPPPRLDSSSRQVNGEGLWELPQHSDDESSNSEDDHLGQDEANPVFNEPVAPQDGMILLDLIAR